MTDERIFELAKLHLGERGHDLIWQTDPEYARAMRMEKDARWSASSVRAEQTLALARAIERDLHGTCGVAAAVNPWKEAVLDALANCCMDAALDEDPSSILKRVIAAEVQIALNPAVSSEAQALIDRGAAGVAHPLDAMLPEICQLLDTCREDFMHRGLWTEWDQSVRDRITAYNLSKQKAAAAVGDPRHSMRNAGVMVAPASEPTGPVAWEYRAWRDGQGGEPVGWGAWERVKPKGLQSMADAVQEMIGYIQRGHRYELRSLLAGPTIAHGVAACDGGRTE